MTMSFLHSNISFGTLIRKQAFHTRLSIFHPCILVPLFPVSHFSPSHIGPTFSALCSLMPYFPVSERHITESDYPGEPVPEETFTHAASWSSSNLYQLIISTRIHSILPVQTTCLAIQGTPPPGELNTRGVAKYSDFHFRIHLHRREYVCLISHCCSAASLLYRQQPVAVLCPAAGRTCIFSGCQTSRLEGLIPRGHTHSRCHGLRRVEYSTTDYILKYCTMWSYKSSRSLSHLLMSSCSTWRHLRFFF